MALPPKNATGTYKHSSLDAMNAILCADGKRGADSRSGVPQASFAGDCPDRRSRARRERPFRGPIGAGSGRNRRVLARNRKQCCNPRSGPVQPAPARRGEFGFSKVTSRGGRPPGPRPRLPVATIRGRTPAAARTGREPAEGGRAGPRRVLAPSRPAGRTDRRPPPAATVERPQRARGAARPGREAASFTRRGAQCPVPSAHATVDAWEPAALGWAGAGRHMAGGPEMRTAIHVPNPDRLQPARAALSGPPGALARCAGGG